MEEWSIVEDPKAHREGFMELMGKGNNEAFKFDRMKLAIFFSFVQKETKWLVGNPTLRFPS